MIIFPDSTERTLLGDLKEAGLVTPVVMEAATEALGRPERYDIAAFLLAAADSIDERQWLYWLIRERACFRFGPVALDPSVIDSASPPLNLPYHRLADGTALVAILRPDLSAEGYRAAATLRELRQLRIDWARLRR